MNQRNNILPPNHRRKQINTLHIFNENVVEVRHDVEYRITWIHQIHQNIIPLTLVIVLPQDFPFSRPVIRMFAAKSENYEANLTHPWLNADNVVIGSPGLNSFGIHSELGRVVQAIKREFERNPPVIKSVLNQVHGKVKDDIVANVSTAI